MNEKVMQYNGFHNQVYSFTDEAGKLINFSKVRSELIRQFQLKSKSNVLKRFKVIYFVKSADLYDIYFVSDLEEVV